MVMSMKRSYLFALAVAIPVYIGALVIRDPVPRPEHYTHVSIADALKSNSPVEISGTPFKINENLINPFYPGIECMLTDGKDTVKCKSSDVHGRFWEARDQNSLNIDSVKNAFNAFRDVFIMIISRSYY